MKNIFLLILPILISGCSVAAPITAPQETPDQPKDQVVEKVKFETSEIFPEYSIKFNAEWPTDLTKKEIAQTAVYNSFVFFDNNADSLDGQHISLVTQDIIDQESVRLLSKSVSTFEKGFDDYLEVEHTIFIGNSVSWLSNEANILGLELPQSYEKSGNIKDFSQWGPESMLDNRQTGWANKNMAYIGVDIDRMYGEHRTAWISGHELYHSVHLVIDGGAFFGYDYAVPKWFYEGSAEFFSTAVAAWGNDFPYFSPVPKSGSFSMPITIDQSPGLENCEDEGVDIVCYHLGHAAIEYLIATNGAESILDVHRFVGSGLSFEESFILVYDISLEDFYKLYENNLLVLYIDK